MNLSRREIVIGAGSLVAAPIISLLSFDERPFKFDIERVVVKAQSRALKAEYTLEIAEPVTFIGGRSWDGSIDHGIKLIDDILKENEPKTTSVRTEDGVVLWTR